MLTIAAHHGSTFVGRHGEIATLTAWLANPDAAIAIAGPPGIGKSRLAAEVAARRFGASHRHVDASDSTWPEKMADAADAALVLLDNVNPGCSRLAKIVEQPHRPRLLVTLCGSPPEGLRTLWLGGLPAGTRTSDATALLEARARLVGDERFAPILIAIAEQLGGHPLAIELVARRFDAFTPSQLLEHIDEPGIFWSSGDTTDLLTAALGEVWARLTPEQQRMACAASAFAGDFAPADLGAVVRDPERVTLTDLQSLRDVGWFVAGRGDGRFAQLTPFARFATHASSDELVQLARRQHADYIACAMERLAEREEIEGRAPARDELRRLWAEAARVERWANAAEPARLDLVRRIAIAAGEPPRARDWTFLLDVQRAVIHHLASSKHRVNDPDVLLAHAKALCRTNRHTEATPFIERASETIDDRSGALQRARLEVLRGQLAGAERRFADGAQHLDRAVHLFRAAGRRSLAVRTQGQLGGYWVHSGDPDRGLAMLAVAWATATELRSPLLCAEVAIRWGTCLIDRRELEAGVGKLETAYDAAQQAGHERLRMAALCNLGAGYQELGRLDDADRCLRCADQIARASDSGAAAEIAWRLGVLEEERSRLGAAAECYERSLGIATLQDHQVLAGLAMACLARVRARQGNFREARSLAAAATPRVVASDYARCAAICVAHALRLCGDDIELPGQDGATIEERLALRLPYADSRPAPVGAPTVEPDGLTVHTQCMWIRLPGDQVVDLSRRAPMRRVVSALVARRLAEPGRPLGVYDLADAGWPDEKLDAESAAKRLHATLSRLRKLGLEHVLVYDGDGYYLSPDLACDVRSSLPRG